MWNIGYSNNRFVCIFPISRNFVDVVSLYDSALFSDFSFIWFLGSLVLCVVNRLWIGLANVFFRCIESLQLLLSLAIRVNVLSDNIDDFPTFVLTTMFVATSKRPLQIIAWNLCTNKYPLHVTSILSKMFKKHQGMYTATEWYQYSYRVPYRNRSYLQYVSQLTAAVHTSNVAI